VRNGDGSVAWHGPWAADVTALGFDGRDLAFRAAGCAYAGPVGGWEPRLPAGVCARSDATALADVRRNRLIADVTCVNAPGDRCRVTATVRTQGGALLGRGRADVRRGRAARFSFRLRASARRIPRDELRVSFRLTDPDGRSREVPQG
jgi:hypothetical protein